VTPDWSLRILRAAGFGAVCTLVSAAAHRYGGGALPGPGGTGLAVLLTALGAFLLGGRERDMRVLLPATSAAQYGLHELFGRLAPAAAGPVNPDLPVMADTGHSGPAMLLAHLTVVLLTAAWLRRGEELFCSLVRRTAARLLRLLRYPPVSLPLLRRPVRGTVRTLVPAAVVTAVGRRGPPPADSL